MLRNMMIDVLRDTWPILVICSIIFVSMRIVYLVKSDKKIYIHKELLTYLFGIYIMCLFTVVTYQDVESYGNNFTPFKEMFRYTLGSNLFIKNVIGNMVMFMPYGFFTGYFLKINKVSVVLLLSMLVSTSIEVIQGYIGRVFDIDDIILNVIGSIIGFLIYKLFNKIKDRLPKILRNTIFYSIIILILIVLFILYLMKIIEVYNV
ncbi:MAG: VanZ family protein [Bacillales bacterium]|nr:VanZ family protein [Bacillales bacterium]